MCICADISVFKPGAPAAGQHMPGFLKLILCGSSVCVYVCPSPKLLITSSVMLHDMDSIQLVKQVI